MGNYTLNNEVARVYITQAVGLDMYVAAGSAAARSNKSKFIGRPRNLRHFSLLSILTANGKISLANGNNQTDFACSIMPHLTALLIP